MGHGQGTRPGRGRSWTRRTRCARTCCCASPACSTRALFVGDPGQLDPFSTVQTERWTGLTWDPMQSAVAVLLRHNPDIPVHRLPVSWRLPEPAVDRGSRGVLPLHRVPRRHDAGAAAAGVHHQPVRQKSLDEALETAAASGWALYELPGQAHRPHRRRGGDRLRRPGRPPPAARSLFLIPNESWRALPSPRAGSRWGPRTGTRPRRSVRCCRRTACAGITVDTANRLQGREFDVVIVLHPLSGRRDATAFHLEAGRLCVLTTRHRHACIVVARAGIPELLDAHPSTEPVHLNVPVKFPDGWEANQAVMARLQQWK